MKKIIITAVAVFALTACATATTTAEGGTVQKAAAPDQNKAAIFEGTWIGLDERDGYYSTLVFNGNTITMINQKKDGTEEPSSFQRTFYFNGNYPDTSIIGRSIEPYTITIFGYGGETSTMYYHINENELKLSVPINAENYYRLKSIMDAEDYDNIFFRTFIIETAYRAGDTAQFARNAAVAVTVENDRNNQIGGALSDALARAGFRAGDRNSRYVIKAAVAFSETALQNQPNLKLVRWELEANLIDTSTGNVLLPYEINGRDGHTTLAAAEIRAMRSIENKINEEYTAALVSIIYHRSIP